MVAAVKFQAFVEELGKGTHNFSSHTFKVALTNTAPTASTDDELADITQIANGNGYTTGGLAVSGVVWSRSGGTAKLTITDLVITASGGDMAAWRYAVLFNDTSTGDKLICYWARSASVTLENGDSLTLDFDGSAGVLTVT